MVFANDIQRETETEPEPPEDVQRSSTEDERRPSNGSIKDLKPQTIQITPSEPTDETPVSFLFFSFLFFFFFENQNKQTN